MSARSWIGLAGTLALLVSIGRSADAAETGPATPGLDCNGPATERAPDPRCGEALDGRDMAAVASGPREAGRVALLVPRAVMVGVFWPVIETENLIESHHLDNWMVALLTSDDGRVGVRPIVKYSTGFVSTVGLRIFDKRLPGDGSGVAASFQTAGPSVLMAEIDGAAPRWTGLTFRGIFNSRDDRYFAGIGPLTDADLAANGWSPARYGSTNLAAEVRWTKRLPAHFQLALHSDLQDRDYRATGVRGGPSVATVFRTSSPGCQYATEPVNACVDPVLLPGFENGLHIGHEGIGVLWDYRAHTRDGSGAALGIDATFAEGVANDPSRHVVLSAEPMVALGGHDRQLILRGRVAMVDAVGDAPIPFEELVMMSGMNGMRGYLDGRFRGESGAVGTAEYRWYVGRRIDASIFTDVGTVAGHHFAGIGSAPWFPSYGAGLRLYDAPGEYWEGAVDSGIQVVYAPGNGVRFMFVVAAF
jgi:Omp85 superfamily domain